MKIEYPDDTDITYNFVDLDLGDVFTEDNGEYYYIKCEMRKLDPSDPSNTNNEPYINAVDIENGRPEKKKRWGFHVREHGITTYNQKSFTIKRLDHP